MTTDLTKPVQTACGFDAEVMVTDRNGPDGCSVVVNVRGALHWYRTDGTNLHRNPDMTLVNVPPPEPLKVMIRMTPEDAARVGEDSMNFCRNSGLAEMASYDECLAHFTALAHEQQRGEG